MRRSTIAPLGLFLALSGAALAGPVKGPVDGPLGVPSPAAESAFAKSNPESHFYRTGSRITSVYGKAFSFGATAKASAESFRAAHAGLFGVAPGELVDGTLATDGRSVRELMPDPETGRAKFTLVSYVQQRDGVPVFRGEARLLVRNEAGFPLVLARANVRDLGEFRVNANAAENLNVGAAFTDAMRRFPGMGNFTTPRVVVWAGVDSGVTAPRLAMEFFGTIGDPSSPGYDRVLIIADASTGRTIWTEGQVCHADITGTVKGMATPPKKADTCTAETLSVMPYARIDGPSGPFYADALGGFSYPATGVTTLTSGVRGRWFKAVDAAAGGTDPEVLSGDFGPPGPADFVHNQANTSATIRSAVNAYIAANTVRDYALRYSPTFPTITTQTEFRINVNVSGLCNAFYDGSSINFFAAGGVCPSSAYSDIVWHEYAHHMVASAGSGQGSYGEGAADMLALLISDDAAFGYGFYGNCNNAMRTAINTKQYPCAVGEEIHTCGTLLTGAVWDTRNELVVTNPSNYRDIISSLAINAIIVHTGTDITPQITIDFLTLNDNDSNIGNGTPNYAQINAGFSKHNMPAPVLNTLSFVFPLGRPTVIPPGGGNVFTIQVIGSGNTTPIDFTGQFFCDADDNGTYVQADMVRLAKNFYQVTFPATPCGSRVRYYFSTLTTLGTYYNPTGAPTSAHYIAVSGATMKTASCDTFASDTGWVATKTAGVTTGAWERAIPVNNNRGDPPADFDGSGMCYTTDNRAGDFDIDGGSVTLTSPAFDGSGAGDVYISYARWFHNSFGNNPNSDTMVVQASGDNGNSWVTVETVGPTIDSAGGWKTRLTRLGGFVPMASQMKVRFTANDTGSAATVEAAIDDVKIYFVNCTKCPSDYNLNGFVNGIDFDEFVAAFDAGDCTADWDNNGFVNGEDFDGFVAAFEAGC